MDINSKLIQCKQQRIKAVARNKDSYRFFNLLTGPNMLEQVESLLPENHRERQFPPTEFTPTGQKGLGSNELIVIESDRFL